MDQVRPPDATEGDAAAPSARAMDGSPPPPPLSRTKWTRRVPHPVLIGHAFEGAGQPRAAAAWLGLPPPPIPLRVHLL